MINSAFRVGLLVVVAAVLLIGAYFFLGVTFSGPSENIYYAKLANAGGISEGVKVTLAGIQVGEIKSVKLKNPHEVLVSLGIDKSVSIPKGSKLVVHARLVGIGEPDVSIVAPTGQLPPLSPGSFLLGEETAVYSSLLPGVDQTLDELKKTLTAVRTIFENPILQDRMASLVDSVQLTVKQLGLLAKGLDAHLDVGVSDMNQITQKLLPTLDNVQIISSNIARLAKEGDFKKIFQETDRLLLTSRTLVEDLKSTLNDSKLRAPLEDSLKNIDSITETGKKIASNAEIISEKGIVFSDKAIEVVEKANQLGDEAKKLLNQFNGTVDQFLKNPPLGKIRTEADLVYQTKKKKKLRSDVNFVLPVFGQEYRVGFYDAFEKNRLNLQKMLPFNQDSYFRFGMYAAKPGVGVDFNLARGVCLSSDVYGLNKLHFNVHTQVAIADGFTLWAELNDIFRQNVPGFGIGYRK